MITNWLEKICFGYIAIQERKNNSLKYKIIHTMYGLLMNVIGVYIRLLVKYRELKKKRKEYRNEFTNYCHSK